MKKFIKSTALILAGVLILAGCGTKPETQENLGGQSAQKEFARGEWAENVYTSEFAEIKYELPEAWVYATDEEIKEVIGQGVDLINDSSELDVSEDYLDQAAVYDMFAQNPATGSNVQVIFESMKSVPGSSRIDENAYIEITKELLISTEIAEYNFSDSYEITIGGNTYTVLDLDYELWGVSVQQRYCTRKIGDFMTAVIITDASGGDIDEIMSGFSGL